MRKEWDKVINLKTELLAPAKDKETAFTAIDCGADAVYIGAGMFGARKNASNTLDDIEEVVLYAHKFKVKVFVTVNTILNDNEIDSAVELVKKLDKVNVDAILIQDMGLLEKLIELNLSIPVHASTQCDNRDIEKIKFFKNIGLSRVVLARELSLDEIAKIHKEVPDIELEAFIHGALCVSYSGQCYLSQYIGGRSANRGECAQPCRKRYSLLNEKGDYIEKNAYLLCLKDLNASLHIKEMIDNGIFSFKIEGRLKDKEYVKNVVSYYRKILDKYSQKTSSGKMSYSFMPSPEKSFNRGFTDYFLVGRTNCYNFISPKSRGKYLGKIINADKNCFIIKSEEIISPQDGLCFEKDGSLEGFLVNKTEKTELGTIVYPNRKINIKKNIKIYRNYDANFEKELKYPVKRQIGLNITVDKNEIVLRDEDNTTLTINIENKEKAKNQEQMNSNFIKQFSKTGQSDYYTKDIEIKNDIPFISISELNKLRRDSFETLTNKRIKEYKRNSQMSIKHAPFYKKEVDYRANIHNKYAKEFYKKCGTKVNELSLESNLPNRQIELMRTKHCIKYALNMCKSTQQLFLEDEKHKKYPLKFDCQNCEMVILSP